MKDTVLLKFVFSCLCFWVLGSFELQAQADCEMQHINHSYQVRRNASMPDAKFNILLSKIKKKSFTDDKMDIVEVASLGCRYTCYQCVKILELFTFDSEKLKALQLLSPQIVDSRNNYDIIKIFTFDSDKEKAAQILQCQDCRVR